MGPHSDHHDHGHAQVTPELAASPGYRRVLWIALVVIATRFIVEMLAGWRADSVSLLADAVDFFGDAGSYALSLAVLGMALRVRAGVALLKGLCMGLFGVFVLGKAFWNFSYGASPDAMTMGLVGLLALIANVAVAALLYQWREGDANMRSVWLCSRNDAIGNLLVVAAAAGVFGTGVAWPDLTVAAIMGFLALAGSWAVVRQALSELRHGHADSH